MNIGLFNLGRRRSEAGFCFDRPLVILQSDDWGRVGVCDRAGFEQLRGVGISLGQHPYDFYTLETAEDVTAVRDLLKRHHDSTGRPACMVMNFVMANVDFVRTLAGDCRQIHLISLSKGLPDGWNRPGLLEAYRHGIAGQIFYPALHGVTHFCRPAVDAAIAEGGERAALLKTLWTAKTPYVYWRMPWVGYEYHGTGKFLPPLQQQNLIGDAVDGFAKLFSTFPHSACAPGYRANRDTYRAWSSRGIRVAQNGSGAPLPPSMDEWEILNLHRTIDFEPSQRDLQVEKYLELAGNCFHRGAPVIISVHAINFHSTLRNFRDATIPALDQLLSALEAKYPELLYVHDEDVYKIVTTGKFESTHGTVTVKATRVAGVGAAGK